MLPHLFRKRSVYVPTWKLSLLLVILIGGIVFGVLHNLYPFLARTDPVERPEVLVVDGWMSDQSMEAALAMAREQSCELILTAGVELPTGYHLSRYKTYAHLGEATLEALGGPADEVHPAPAGAHVRHRTFASAAAVYQWLEKENRLDARITIVTEGPHSRRSLAVYRKVFGDKGSGLRVASLPSRSYDPAAWWKTSAGMKSVIVETIAVADEWLRDSGRSSNDPHSIVTGIVP